MAYLKINNIDFSNYVSGLKVTQAVNYVSQTNARGDTVVDFRTRKSKITVETIPMNDAAMQKLMNELNGFEVVVEYLNPTTKLLESKNCIIPETEVEYLTIQVGDVKFREANMNFIEL